MRVPSCTGRVIDEDLDAPAMHRIVVGLLAGSPFEAPQLAQIETAMSWMVPEMPTMA